MIQILENNVDSKFLVKSGSSDIYVIHLDNKKIIKKKIYRKPKEKFNKEVKALTILKDYKYFPKILVINKEEYSIYMSYCGYKITFDNIPKNWEIQVKNIINILNQTNIVHGDINPGNICVQNNQIYLIDFGNIRFFGDKFFEENDFNKYREMQHNKLYKICVYVSENKNPWKLFE